MVCNPALRHDILSMKTLQLCHKNNHGTKGVSLMGSRITSFSERMPNCSVPWESAATGYRDLRLPIRTLRHYHVTCCAALVLSKLHSP